MLCAKSWETQAMSYPDSSDDKASAAWKRAEQGVDGSSMGELP